MVMGCGVVWWVGGGGGEGRDTRLSGGGDYLGAAIMIMKMPQLEYYSGLLGISHGITVIYIFVIYKKSTFGLIIIPRSPQILLKLGFQTEDMLDGNLPLRAKK